MTLPTERISQVRKTIQVELDNLCTNRKDKALIVGQPNNLAKHPSYDADI